MGVINRCRCTACGYGEEVAHGPGATAAFLAASCAACRRIVAAPIPDSERYAPVKEIAPEQIGPCPHCGGSVLALADTEPGGSWPCPRCAAPMAVEVDGIWD